MSIIYTTTQRSDEPARPADALKVSGVGRDAENDKALVFSFSRIVTDDEMRFLHEVMRRTVAISLPNPQK